MSKKSVDYTIYLEEGLRGLRLFGHRMSAQEKRDTAQRIIGKGELLVTLGHIDKEQLDWYVAELRKLDSSIA